MILVDTDGFVCRHPHNMQIDGVKCKLSQDTGKDRGNSELGVQQTGA